MPKITYNIMSVRDLQCFKAIHSNKLYQEELRNEQLKREQLERFRNTLLQRYIIESSFETRIVGVTFSNSGDNASNRQDIIQKLIINYQLEEDQELLLCQQPTNPYDNHAIAVRAMDGQQLGYLPKFIANHVFNQLDHGILYKAFVSNITCTYNGIFGINIRIESYSLKPQATSKEPRAYRTDHQQLTNIHSKGQNNNIYAQEHFQADYQPTNAEQKISDYIDREDINDIAREEGFCVDEDGEWVMDDGRN